MPVEVASEAFSFFGDVKLTLNYFDCAQIYTRAQIYTCAQCAQCTSGDLESFNLGLPRRCAYLKPTNLRRNRLCLAAFGAWHEQSHAVCTASILLLCSPPAALAVSHRTTTLQPLAGT